MERRNVSRSAGLGVGVAAHLVRLGLGERRLGNERPQAGVLGLGGEHRALLVGDREFGAQTLQAIAHVDEPALQQGLGHGTGESTAWPGVWHRISRDAPPCATSEHDELRATVRRFVDTEVRPHVEEWEHAGHFPDALFERCGQLGFLGLHYPARWGGSDGDLAAGVVFVEELARCGAGAIPMAISVQSDMATPALAEFGTDDQRERWLARDRGNEDRRDRDHRARRGSDVAAIRTQAVRDGDVWRVSGRKMFITNGTRRALPDARCQDGCRGGPSRRGAVHRRHLAARRLGVAPAREARHARVDTAEIALDDLRGSGRRSHRPRTGPRVPTTDVAVAVRTAGRRGRVCRQRNADLGRHDRVPARRETFGRPIAQHQVIAHKLADCATELAAAWRVVVRHRLGGDGRRLPGGRDLDVQEVLRGSAEPHRRRVRTGMGRRGLPRRDRHPAARSARTSATHRRRHRRDHERPSVRTHGHGARCDGAGVLPARRLGVRPRYLSRALSDAGWDVSVVSGSLGVPGAPAQRADVLRRRRRACG